VDNAELSMEDEVNAKENPESADYLML